MNANVAYIALHLRVRINEQACSHLLLKQRLWLLARVARVLRIPLVVSSEMRREER